MVNGKPQTNEANAEVSVLRAECDPSLKMSFLNRLGQSGFRTQTDAILTLARDFISGRINYRGGVLQSQEQNSQPDVTDGQDGPSPPRTEVNKKIKASASSAL